MRWKTKYTTKLTESGHAVVGILTVNPNVLSDLTLVGSLSELTIIQTAKLHNKTGIIQLKRSQNGDKIVHRSDGENQYFTVRTVQKYTTLSEQFKNISHCQNNSKIYHTVRTVLKYTKLSEQFLWTVLTVWYILELFWQCGIF
jgi:hypothetical protein